MKPRGRSVNGRAKRLSRGSPHLVHKAVALSLVKLLGSPVSVCVCMRERGNSEVGRQATKDPPTGTGGVVCNKTITISVALPSRAALH